MLIYMYRKHKQLTYTIGRIYFVDMRCDTLEPPVRELLDINGDGDFEDEGEGKVYGNTAIPLGRYKIMMQPSPTFKRDMPYLQNVKGFTDVMIHPGNQVGDTKACILVGENVKPGKLINSRAWSDVLNLKISLAIEAGEEVWIEINE